MEEIKERDNLQNNNVKSKLRYPISTGEDFKLYLLMQFGTYEAASKPAGFSSDRIHQIASGYQVPESPDIIKRLAEAWHIDIVVLTALFERLRRKTC